MQTKPRKLPVQRRSKDVVEAILLAAGRVLVEQGYASFNTNRVAEVAGVSIGSLYQYFPSKESILMSIIEQKREKLLANMKNAAAQCVGRDLQGSLELLVVVAIESKGSWPRLARVLALAEHDLPIAQAGLDLKSAIANTISIVLSEHDIDHPETAARDIMYLADALIHAAYTSRPTDLKILRMNILNAVKGYLRIF
ncbi:TetR/AcrR family transcriptional regulator [Maritalea sp.]|uniref:TetR/AcrR family transcriptional regulator n=1 Tax=Maritalea sp. TaxID=2003361 RepID=UPI0039E6C42F